MAKYNRKRTTRRKYNGKRKLNRKRRIVKRASARPASGGRRRMQSYDAYINAAGTVYKHLNDAGVLPTSAPRRGGPSGVVRLGDNISASYTTMGRNRSFSSAKMVGRRTWFNSQVGIITGTTGNQFISSHSSLQKTELDLLKTDLQAAVGDMGTSSATNSFKMWIGKVKQTIEVKNQTNHVGTLTLYNVVPKRQALTSAVDTPLEAWTTGLADQVATGTTNYHLIPGSTPYESAYFRRYFKVVGVKKVYLEPGETHSHTFIRNINRVISTVDFEDAVTSIVKSLSAHIMIVGHGGIGHNDADDTASVSYMPLRLDYINKQTVTAGAYPQSAVVTKVVTNAISTTAPAAWNFMTESGDVTGGLTTS